MKDQLLPDKQQTQGGLSKSPTKSRLSNLFTLLFGIGRHLFPTGNPTAQDSMSPRINGQHVKTHPITTLHCKINLCDLASNGSLLTAAEQQRAQRFFNNPAHKDIGRVRRINAQGEVSYKYDDKLRYAVLKFADATSQDDYYAIYFGFKSGRHLGRGSFGKVKLMQHQQTQEWFALKVINSNVSSSDITSEITALTATRQFIGKLSRPDDRYKTYLGMKLAPGKDLLDLQSGADKHTQPKNTLPLAERLRIAMAMLEAVDTLHKQGILHRDLKPENMIYDRLTRKLKLVDFGFSIPIHDAARTPLAIGTPGFLAPELLSLNSPFPPNTFSTATEMFAVGVSLLELFKLAKYVKGAFALTIDDATVITDPTIRGDIAHFLMTMTSDHPNNRPTAEQAMQFFTSIINDRRSDPSLAIKTAIVDLQEYQTLTVEKKAAFIELFKTVDEVYLVDHNHQLQHEYPALYHELARHSVLIHNQILYCDLPNATLAATLRCVPTYLDTAYPDSTRQYHYLTAAVVLPELKISLERARLNVMQPNPDNFAQDRPAIRPF